MIIKVFFLGQNFRDCEIALRHGIASGVHMSSKEIK